MMPRHSDAPAPNLHTSFAWASPPHVPRRDSERLDEDGNLGPPLAVVRNLVVQPEPPCDVAPARLAVEGLDKVGLFLDLAPSERQTALD